MSDRTPQPAPPVFVTGTDTEIGKTWVSAALLRGYAAAGVRAAGVKPVASGSALTPDGLRNSDATTLQALSAGAPDYATVNPFCLEPPIAPLLAARDAGVRPALQTVQAGIARLQADRVLVEGAGGWLVSVNDDELWPDWVAAAGWPVLLVVGMRLGGLNHALLSAREIMRTAPLLGWVANCLPPEQPRLQDNLDWLRAQMPAPCLGVLGASQGMLGVDALEQALADVALRHPQTR